LDTRKSLDATGPRIASQPEKWLHQSADDATELDGSLHRDQANALFDCIYDRAMLDVLIRIVAIAGGVPPALMNKRTLQNAGHFGAGVRMMRQFDSWRGFQQEYPRGRSRRHLDGLEAQPRRNPTPFAERIIRQRCPIGGPRRDGPLHDLKAADPGQCLLTCAR